METSAFPGDMLGAFTSRATLRISLKVIGGFLALSLAIGGVFQVLGHPLLAGMTLALGSYLIISSILFITIPLLLVDRFFD